MRAVTCDASFGMVSLPGAECNHGSHGWHGWHGCDAGPARAPAPSLLLIRVIRVIRGIRGIRGALPPCARRPNARSHLSDGAALGAASDDKVDFVVVLQSIQYFFSLRVFTIFS